VSTTRIPPDEVEFHPHSFGDRDGRLFRWQGQLYRGLRGERAAFFDELVRAGTIAELAAEGLLVEAEPTDLALDGYASVVRQREVHYPSYPIEWSPTMFRDASLLYLRLVERLLPLGVTLKDVHPWNLVFDFARPVYVDLTSLTALENGLPAHEKVARYYLRPLLLMERGGERIARSLLFDYDAVQAADLELLGVPALPGGRRPLLRRRRSADPGLVAEWRRLAEGLKLPDDTGGRERTPTSAVLAAAVEQLRPASVLLLQGDPLLAERAAAGGSDVVVFDESSQRVTSLYRRAREAGARILPLVLDFSRPTPSIGFSGHYSVAASERLRCELLALHGEAYRRLAGDRSLRPDLLAEGFAQFTQHRLVLERGVWSEELAAALHSRFRPIDGGGGDVVLLEKLER
jgi:hypothetical protein